jgi:hypothetical protein
MRGGVFMGEAQDETKERAGEGTQVLDETEGFHLIAAKDRCAYGNTNKKPESSSTAT